jgi:nuclear transport factor 2 (NTF2) superfamily protein
VNLVTPTFPRAVTTRVEDLCRPAKRLKGFRCGSLPAHLLRKETAGRRYQKTEGAWDSRFSERVALVHSRTTSGGNRSVIIVRRAELAHFLVRNGNCELNYRLSRRINNARM